MNVILVLTLPAIIEAERLAPAPVAAPEPTFFTRDTIALLSVAGLAALLLLFRMGLRIYKLFTERNRPQPHRLFRELCRRHELPTLSVQLLRHVAKVRRLPHPVHLFVRPDFLAADEATPQLIRHAERLTELKTKLFGAAAR